MIVVLLGCVGLTAGLAFGTLLPSYRVIGQPVNVTAGLLLPAHSPYSGSELEFMTRDDHPGVRVVAYGGHCRGCRWLKRHIGFSAFGSLGDAERAVHLAVREAIAANDGKVEQTWGGALRVPRSGHNLTGHSLTGYVLFGLLAGLSAALGFLVPPRSRVTAVH
jgi:hypothetical protein